MASYTLSVNGERRTIESPPDAPLLWVLRDALGLTGTKYGCGMALCGSCTVHVDGVAVRSCTTRISSAANRKIITIEGLAAAQHPLLQAWIAEEVPQCGYCQPGMLMSAAALLAGTHNPSDEDIDTALSGHICRCGTYVRIRRAIHRASNERLRAMLKENA